MNVHQFKTFAINYIEQLPVNSNSKFSADEAHLNRSLIRFASIYSALVWGSSVKHQPQKVGIEHVLNDEDVVQIVKKV